VDAISSIAGVFCGIIEEQVYGISPAGLRSRVAAAFRCVLGREHLYKLPICSYHGEIGDTRLAVLMRPTPERERHLTSILAARARKPDDESRTL
jgi:hypothetical protein